MCYTSETRMTNFFEHFKTTLFAEFQFLKDFGFSDFEEEQVAYEYHFVARTKNNIKLDIQIELTSSTPIWTSINGIYLDNLFVPNSFFKEYSSELESIYRTIDNPKSITNNQNAFAEKGFALNERYLSFVKSLLIENPEYLQDVSIYDRQHELRKLQTEIELADYLKDFKKLFDKGGQLLVTETFFKAQFENNLLTVETDKISADFNSYEEFVEFLNSFSSENIQFENINYKFEPK